MGGPQPETTCPLGQSLTSDPPHDRPLITPPCPRRIASTHLGAERARSRGRGHRVPARVGERRGGTSGIRFGSSRLRAKPPEKLTFDDFATKSPAAIGAPNDKVWVYAIIQYSKLWKDCANILDVCDPQDSGWPLGSSDYWLAP
jgi:hypothetical protein